MKKLISILLCLLLLLTVFSSCDKKEPAIEPTEKPTETPNENTTDTVSEDLPDEVIYDGETYKVERIDGKCYVTIKDYVHEEQYVGPGLHIAPKVDFDSFDEFKNALLFGGLSEEQLNELKKCSWPDENGRIEIFEIYNLRQPKLPIGAEVSQIIWKAKTFCYVIKAGSNIIWMWFLTEDSYKSLYKSYITDSTDSYVIFGDGVKYEVNLRVNKTSFNAYDYNMFSYNADVFLHIDVDSDFLIAEEWLLQLGY